MYHWTTSTCYTLSSQASGATFWRSNIAELGFAHHHLLHLILAFTALHLARARPSRHIEYKTQAEHHYALALPDLTSELAHLNVENGDAVYVSVQLTCFITWARGPRPGD